MFRHSMTTHVSALVVGAGISGLACAYYLRKSGIEAEIVEASSRPGGMIRSERREGFLLELGPQSFSSTPQLTELCRDLGIASELVEAPPRAPRFLLLNGQLRPAPLDPLAFFASSLFSARTKASVLRDLFGHSSPPDADESVADFIRRKFSPELLDKLVGPFVSGIYAGDPEELSLRAAFPKLHEAEIASGSIIRGMLRAARTAKSQSGPKKRSTLQSFRDGNETLVSALAGKLGSALRTEVSVSGISCKSMASSVKFEVELSARGSTEKITADNLVLAAPTHVIATLLRNPQNECALSLASIEYAPVGVVSLGYVKSAVGRSLDGFGFLIPRSEGLRTLGTVWNSSLFPARAPDGHALLTSFVGGSTDPQAATLSSDELVSLVHNEIARLLNVGQPPVFSNVTLYARALPQYNLGHSERLAAVHKLSAMFPGLLFAGNYLRGPAIGACLEQAQSVAQAIRASVA
jgi:oxygen-dependent protoporphyrinogen oxidase